MEGWYILSPCVEAGGSWNRPAATDRPECSRKGTLYLINDLACMLHKNSKHEHRKHPCCRCLHVFSSEALLEIHRNDCQGIGEKPQRTEMPKEGQNILNFTNHHKRHHLCRLRSAEHPHRRLCRQSRKKATHSRSQSRSHGATAM